jgi:ribosomal protein S18 acetylase RimI-like enzyme
MLAIRLFQALDEEAVITLWSACGLLRPWNDPHKDIQRKLQVQPDLFLVATLDSQVIGSVMAGYDGHRGWIYYLAVHPDSQQSGIGRQLAAAAEQRLQHLGCPKINLLVRRDNEAVTAFYTHLGYTLDDVLTLGKRLEHDGPPSPHVKA